MGAVAEEPTAGRVFKYLFGQLVSASVLYGAVFMGIEGLGNIYCALIWACFLVLAAVLVLLLMADEEHMDKLKPWKAGVFPRLSKYLRFAYTGFFIYHGWWFTAFAYVGAHLCTFFVKELHPKPEDKPE